MSLSVQEKLCIARMLLHVPFNSALWAELAPLTFRMCFYHLTVKTCPFHKIHMENKHTENDVTWH